MVPWKPFRCPVTVKRGLEIQMRIACADTQRTGGSGQPGLYKVQCISSSLLTTAVLKGKRKKSASKLSVR